jgi:20S proteasome subunit alpha 2
MVSAKTFLEKRYNEDMEIEDAIHTAILTLKEGLEGTLGEDSIEVGIAFFEEKEEHGAHVDELDGKRVKKVGKFKVIGKAEIKDFLVNIQ